MRAAALLLGTLAATGGVLLLLPRAGGASPAQDAWERTLVLHRYGVELGVRAAGAPPGFLRVSVRDLGPGVPGLAEDLPPTAATLTVNGAAPAPLEPGPAGELHGLLPLAALRPWLSDRVLLEVHSDLRRLCAVDLDLLVP